VHEHDTRSLPETKVIQLDSRRDLAWIEVGDPGGTPVIALHGSPSRHRIEMGSFESLESTGQDTVIATINPAEASRIGPAT